ncbi:MAG: PTS sugar transporter subunit IIA [Clostridium sp.]|nr:PTS sugar transporter subunit IIA [Clostridium sp.]
MVTGRMLAIAQYLNKERMASYKEVAAAIGIKERIVRYDIDSINNELSLRKMMQIEKYPKGMLFVPDDLDLEILGKAEKGFVFSSHERIAVIRLIILFDTENLNIKELTGILQVSRRSIQYDIDTVQKEFEMYNLSLKYDRKFKLEGESELSYRLRSGEMKRYVDLLYKRERLSAYEEYMQKKINSIFLPVYLADILSWINGVMEQLGWVLSDDSYQWYVSNVITFTWYLSKKLELPQSQWQQEGEIDQSIGTYETYVGRSLSNKERGILSGFARYTNRYVHFDVKLELMAAEDLVMRLIKEMGGELHINFQHDGILVKGLLNHIMPMIERMKGNLQLNEDVIYLIPEEYKYVYNTLSALLDKDKILSKLTENEMVYLAIYFMGSLRRMQQERYMTALLVCGFGYGTTAMVKDALLSEYQIYVKECIPAYKVKSYRRWQDIDIVITTVKVELPVEKPYAQVHVIFEKEDYVKLDLLGLRRKSVLTNYFAIQRRLDFLDDENREKVMNVIKEELGYKEVRMPSKYYTVSDLLGEDHIRIIERVESWRDAVRLCTCILEEHGCILEDYYKSIIQGIEIQGFYSVTDNSFALLHGSETAGIQLSCMSLIICREPVCFGDKKVNIIFCLASRDKKEHVPAVIRLVRMANMTGLIESLKNCISQGQAMQVIRECEKEVERN